MNKIKFNLIIVMILLVLFSFNIPGVSGAETFTCEEGGENVISDTGDYTLENCEGEEVTIEANNVEIVGGESRRLIVNGGYFKISGGTIIPFEESALNVMGYGSKITGNVNIGGTVYVKDGSVTIEGGTINAEKVIAAVWVRDGIAIIMGGTIKGGTHDVYVMSGSVTIAGDAKLMGAKNGVSVNGGGTAKISGGIINGFVSSMDKGVITGKSGYVIDNDGEGGHFYYLWEKGVNIRETPKGTFVCEEQKENGIFTEGEYTLENCEGKEVTIYANNVEIVGGDSGDLIVKGNNFKISGGTITGGFYGVHVHGGKAEINGGTIIGDCGVCVDSGKAEINGGKITGRDDGVRVDSGKAEINSGIIIAINGDNVISDRDGVIIGKVGYTATRKDRGYIWEKEVLVDSNSGDSSDSLLNPQSDSGDSSGSWTYQSAIDKIKNENWETHKYKKHKEFVIQLHNGKLITDEELDKIDGGFFGFGQKNMQYVLDLLQTHKGDQTTDKTAKSEETVGSAVVVNDVAKTSLEQLIDLLGDNSLAEDLEYLRQSEIDSEIKWRQEKRDGLNKIIMGNDNDVSTHGSRRRINEVEEVTREIEMLQNVDVVQIRKDAQKKLDREKAERRHVLDLENDMAISDEKWLAKKIHEWNSTNNFVDSNPEKAKEMNIKKQPKPTISDRPVRKGDSKSGILYVFVKDNTTKKRLEGVSVKFGDLEVEGTRDNMGGYIIGDIPPGKDMVVFELEGYESITQKVKIKAGKVTSVDIALTKKEVEKEKQLETSNYPFSGSCDECEKLWGMSKPMSFKYISPNSGESETISDFRSFKGDVGSVPLTGIVGVIDTKFPNKKFNIYYVKNGKIWRVLGSKLINKGLKGSAPKTCAALKSLDQKIECVEYDKKLSIWIEGIVELKVLPLAKDLGKAPTSEENIEYEMLAVVTSNKEGERSTHPHLLVSADNTGEGGSLDFEYRPFIYEPPYTPEFKDGYKIENLEIIIRKKKEQKVIGRIYYDLENLEKEITTMTNSGGFEDPVIKFTMTKSFVYTVGEGVEEENEKETFDITNAKIKDGKITGVKNMGEAKAKLKDRLVDVLGIDVEDTIIGVKESNEVFSADYDNLKGFKIQIGSDTSGDKGLAKFSSAIPQLTTLDSKGIKTIDDLKLSFKFKEVKDGEMIFDVYLLIKRKENEDYQEISLELQEAIQLNE